MLARARPRRTSEVKRGYNSFRMSMRPRGRLLATAALGSAALFASACSGRRAPAAPNLPPGGIQEGLASWYGLEEAGRATASGEVMDPERMTAAHRTLPFGSLVQVTDLDTRRNVRVIVNDRGPFVGGRIIDLSYAAARELGIVERGVAAVRLVVIGLEGPLAERRWRVQLGSFTDERRARELATLLQAEGYSIVVSPYQDGGTVFHRVWAGAFYERPPAEELARELARKGHRGFVLLAAASSP